MEKAAPFAGPENLIEGTFVERPNRFTLICNIKGTLQKAYLPNPGRLWELLLPGARVFLEKKSRGFTVWATEKQGHIIMLHTHYTNKIAEALIR
ncbi:MAG: hypothetical protein D6778_06440, partial [Nitrospirae bacterium]